MKNEKIWRILLIAVLALQLIAQAFTAVIVFQLNVLPTKYVIVFVAAMVLALGLTAGLMFIPIKKKVGTARRIVACVLALLIVICCAFVSKIAIDAYDAIHSVTTPDDTTDVGNVYVFVREDDGAKEIMDAADYPFAAIRDYDVEHTQQAILKIEELTGKKLQITYYATAEELADALYAKQVNALLMNGASVALLMENEAYEDFMQKTRILHTMSLDELKDPEATTQPETTVPQEPMEITERPFIMYISGSDTRNKKLRTSRSDVNILVVVNPVSKQVLLLNTPRDYYIPNPAGDGALDKLTHCGLYGTKNSMKALGDLYGVTVDYYAQINFTGFETLIDAVGGITVYSPQSFTTRGTVIKKGMNDLNGEQALDLVRDRYHVSGGDNGRGKNQMRVIAALIDKMTSGKTIISNYSDILKSLKGMFKTSFETEDISKLVKMQLSDMAEWNVSSFAVTGTGGSEKNYSSPGHRAYVMYPHKNVVAQASGLIERVLAGDILTDADLKIKK